MSAWGRDSVCHRSQHSQRGPARGVRIASFARLLCLCARLPSGCWWPSDVCSQSEPLQHICGRPALGPHLRLPAVCSAPSGASPVSGLWGQKTRRHPWFALPLNPVIHPLVSPVTRLSGHPCPSGVNSTSHMTLLSLHGSHDLELSCETSVLMSVFSPSGSNVFADQHFDLFIDPFRSLPSELEYSWT